MVALFDDAFQLGPKRTGSCPNASAPRFARSSTTIVTERAASIILHRADVEHTARVFRLQALHDGAAGCQEIDWRHAAGVVQDYARLLSEDALELTFARTRSAPCLLCPKRHADRSTSLIDQPLR